MLQHMAGPKSDAHLGYYESAPSSFAKASTFAKALVDKSALEHV